MSYSASYVFGRYDNQSYSFEDGNGVNGVFWETDNADELASIISRNRRMSRKELDKK